MEFCDQINEVTIEVNMNVFTAKGAEKFHNDKFFKNGSLIPVVSALTGAVGIVGAAAIVAVNVPRLAVGLVAAPALALGERKIPLSIDPADSGGAILMNICFAVRHAFCAIPIVGNAPVCIYAVKKELES